MLRIWIFLERKHINFILVFFCIPLNLFLSVSRRYRLSASSLPVIVVGKDGLLRVLGEWIDGLLIWLWMALLWFFSFFINTFYFIIGLSDFSWLWKRVSERVGLLNFKVRLREIVFPLSRSTFSINQIFFSRLLNRLTRVLRFVNMIFHKAPWNYWLNRIIPLLLFVLELFHLHLQNMACSL